MNPDKVDHSEIRKRAQIAFSPPDLLSRNSEAQPPILAVCRRSLAACAQGACLIQ